MSSACAIPVSLFVTLFRYIVLTEESGCRKKPARERSAPPVSTRFKVRLLGSLAIGDGAEGEASFFQIADTTNRLRDHERTME